MDISLSAWFVILLTLVAANLPFANDRLFGFIPLAFKFPTRSGKPFWVRLIELGVLYACVGGLAYVLESRIGNPVQQKWEFYAITIFLFVVLAFPGFVFRYLRKHSR